MNPAARFDRLDALRGTAMVWMALFHFAFDLNHFGLLDPRQDFYRDPLWTLQRFFFQAEDGIRAILL